MRVMLGPTMDYFLWSVVGGVILAIVYDILRLSRRLINTADIIVNIEDILFIALSGGAAAYVAYAVNNGAFRIYSLLAMAIGFFIYRWLLGNRLIGALVFLFDLLGKAMHFLCRILLAPLRFAVRAIGKPVFLVVGGQVRKFRSRNRRKCEKKE